MIKFVRSLENSMNPLLGPTLWGLKAWGMLQPKGFTNFNSIIYNFIHFSAILFVLSQYVELWMIRSNMQLAMRNLSISMLSTICVIKAATFVYWQNDWQQVMKYVSNLERVQYLTKNPKLQNLMKNYTTYCRKITYFYWGLVMATVFTVILSPVAGYFSSSVARARIADGTSPYPEIMSSWLPFDRTRGFGYWISVVIHVLICFYGGGIVANYDSNAVVLMTFFTGQLEFLSENCSNVFKSGNKDVTFKKALKSIRDCHFHHMGLIRHADLLNSLLSPVLFLYVIVCSLMICASAIQLTTDDTTTMQKIWIAEYLVALVAQLFLYCWHGNGLLVMSEKVDRGIYESAWWSQDVRMRRHVLLLGGQLKKKIIFNAGPFTSLTIPTFITILKGSYSYYTLLSKRKQE